MCKHKSKQVRCPNCGNTEHPEVMFYGGVVFVKCGGQACNHHKHVDISGKSSSTLGEVMDYILKEYQEPCLEDEIGAMGMVRGW